ncbi:toprim domain-containing protein [Pelagicoccus sp. NFK12]|uniref:Toprim domain-containing protein n=1 Tax=Pelagicoccus enzymogenes TaxID=2773457 RepID=A0A927IDS5_9BACT|nr:CHC2 zinc finger domain-containing protein [Pelagicoccus enzymogenes]MBD5778287.1 toprim domain-containing protein [Pelagicoccus enzymogenes]
MPRIPEEELERLKREVDLATLVRSKNIELKPHGSKDLIGKCPFHDDDSPSFVVTPSKNLFHCMGCGAAGSVVDFVMRSDGVSFRHAVELLREQNPRLFGGEAAKRATVPKLESPVAFDANDHALFRQTLDYYRERLLATPPALEYLDNRGISREAIEAFRIGFADRTLGLRLPQKNRKDGAEIRERLTKLGLYRESGHEHFNGCLVFPIFDESGNVAEIYGRRMGKQKSGIYHLYLAGPHRGLLNAKAFESPEVILTESVIDALTFWCAGLRNVTCIWGTEGFTDEHLEAFRRRKIRRVFLAYDSDEAGDRAAERDASRLGSIGIDCFRVQFPRGMDPNEYALKVKPASKSLPLLIQSAKPLFSSKTEVCPDERDTRALSSFEELAANSLVAEEATKEEIPSPQANHAVKLAQLGEDHEVEIGDRVYRVRGLSKNASLEVLKINLRVMHEGLFHVDNLDLYHARQRNAFIVAASEETNLKIELLKRDLGKILLALENLQEKRLKAELEPKSSAVEIPDGSREAALDLLRDPRLLERILTDFAACGVVGERTNKLCGYLAAVSRKLDRPLAIIVQSTSAAGKTSLMEAVLEMMPEEERIKYSAMTGQSLYYLGESDLKHKILAIVEEEGAEKASYALKLLQSEGELTIASTGKDDNGRLKTEEYHVEGPAAIFLTTTAIDIDEELLNRCLVLTVDESREQTQAIHALQRDADTLEGLRLKIERKQILDTHRNAQRLLRPLHVVNPFAPRLTFRSDRTRTRRDHVKYLTLIRTIALLHQHQRPLKREGSLEYIEATLADIEAANSIAHEVLGRSLDELPPQTRRLLGLLQGLVKSIGEEKGIDLDQVAFTRRDARAFTGWSNTQLKLHLDRLEDFEYIDSLRGTRGSSYEYQLAFDGDASSGKPQLMGLIDLEKLRYDTKFTGVDGEFAGQAEKNTGPKRPKNAGCPKPESDASRSSSGGSLEVYRNGHNREASLEILPAVAGS